MDFLSRKIFFGFFSRHIENNFFIPTLALHIVAAEGETNNFFSQDQKQIIFFI